jgi:FkbM family methyltransferase
MKISMNTFDAINFPKYYYYKHNEKKMHQILQKKNHQDFFFIQIGANDGVNGDFINRYITKNRWKGILIEPVKHIFDRLKENYKENDDLKFENVAIDTKKGYRKLYRIITNSDPKMPSFYELLGSFYKKIIEKNEKNIPNYDKLLISEQIKCVTLKDIIKKYKIQNIDLLFIDTEGHDHIIINAIPFNEIKPSLIYYEHKCQSETERKKVRNLLTNNGYTILTMEFDSLAILKNKSTVT